MEKILSWDEVPLFADEEQEAVFWQEHELDARLMSAALHLPSTRESATITLRFDPRMLARIKKVARGRYLNYQSMMKQWLSERLEQELRQQHPDQD